MSSWTEAPALGRRPQWRIPSWPLPAEDSALARLGKILAAQLKQHCERKRLRTYRNSLHIRRVEFISPHVGGVTREQQT